MNAVLVDTLSALHVLAGISWEPEIRGALVTAVGTTVLMGSVWLILATNLGSRLATMVSLAGFFSWMAIMGVIWAFYGIGLRGDTPSWDLVSIEGPADSIEASGDVSNARQLSVLDTSVSAQDLVQRYCPGVVEAVEVWHWDQVQTQDFTSEFPRVPGLPDYCTDEVGEALAVDPLIVELNLREANEGLVEGLSASPLGLDDPRYLQPAELDVAIEEAIRDETVKASQLTLSTLFAGAPALFDQAEADGVLEYGDWWLLSSASAGEAQASADVYLTEAGATEGGFDGSGDYIFLNTYKVGGKPEKNADMDHWDKAWNEIRNTVVFWHPDQYVVVQAVATVEKETIVGQAPPFAEINGEAEVVSVIMKRNRGSLRMPSLWVTLASAVIFVMLAIMLHRRDMLWRAARDSWDPATAGSD